MRRSSSAQANNPSPMRTSIQDILANIEKLNAELREEYDRLAEKYGFAFRKRRVVFLEEFRKRNKEFKFPTWKYVIPTNIRHVLSIPFIYWVFPIAVAFDIAITLYQWIAFTLYRIPRVKRSEYFIYERRFLDYLNIVQKINCLYCSYFNWLAGYAVEIGSRTERFWCPIKAAHKPKFSHDWYKDFADYGNPEEWNEKMKNRQKCFVDAYGDPVSIK